MIKKEIYKCVCVIMVFSFCSCRSNKKQGSGLLVQDSLLYNWSFNNDSILSRNINPQDIFNDRGRAGNKTPVVEWNIVGNSSFYWDDVPIEYSVVVIDAENDKIMDRHIIVTIDYLSEDFDLAHIKIKHKNIKNKLQYTAGLDLIQGTDCSKCHSINKKSSGPKYIDIAARYKGQENAVDLLAKIIIGGGGGVWGKTSMAAHPQYNLNEAREMVKYILSLGNGSISKRYPSKGSYIPEAHAKDDNSGKYILIASSPDKGANSQSPVKIESVLILSASMVEFENFSEASSGINIFPLPGKYLDTLRLSRNVKFVIGIKNNSYIKFDAIDFTGITSLDCGLGAEFGMHVGGNMILRQDSSSGNVIGKIGITVPESEHLSGFRIVTIPLIKSSGIHDLYFTFSSVEYSEKDIGFLDFMRFNIDKPNLP